MTLSTFLSTPSIRLFWLNGRLAGELWISHSKEETGKPQQKSMNAMVHGQKGSIQPNNGSLYSQGGNEPRGEEPGLQRPWLQKRVPQLYWPAREGVRRFQAQAEKQIPPPPLRSASE